MAIEKDFVVKNGLVVGDSANVVGTFTASGITYPASDGSAGQVFTTDGSGNISFSTPISNNDVIAIAEPTALALAIALG